MANTHLSLLLTVLVVVAVLALRGTLIDRHRTPRALVDGGDLFTKTFVELMRSSDLPGLAWIMWMIISAAVSLMPPSQAGMGSYVLDPTAMWVSFNYIILVPCLFGSYVYLIVSIGRFEALNVEARATREPGNRFWLTTPEALFQLAFLGFVLLVQWKSMHSEIAQPYPCSPWVEPAAFQEDLRNCANVPGRLPFAAKDLSLPGALYYTLRGLDSFIALGLIAVIFSALFNRQRLFGQHMLSDFAFPRLAPTRAASDVGTSLVLCILFGSLVTASNGLALWSLARNEPDRARKVALFTESTWAWWAFATVAASIAAGWLIWWLQQRIKIEANGHQSHTLAEYTVPLIEPGHDPSDPARVKRHAEVLEHDLAVRLQIGEVFAKAKTWPLPAIAAPAVIIAGSSQILNIAAAVYTAVFGK